MPDKAHRLRRELRGYAASLALAFLVVTFLFNTVGVVGASMDPTLDGGPGARAILRSILTGDRVFLPKYETWFRRVGIMGPYQRGDIVVLRQPRNAPHALLDDGRRAFFIKRVIGKPGDTVRIDGGRVHVNGVALNETYVESGQATVSSTDFPVITQRNGRATGMATAFVDAGAVDAPLLTHSGAYPAAVPAHDPRVELYYGEVLASLAPIPDDAPVDEPFLHEFTVPEGRYFVMGDNRSEGGSEDSRVFGPVPAMSIAGRASAVIWPPRRDGAWNWKLLGPPDTFTAVPEAPTPR